MTDIAIAKITLTGDAELRVLLQQDRRGRPMVDIRRFELGAGPARVQMATKVGLSLPVADLSELIEALKAAEMASRPWLIGGR